MTSNSNLCNRRNCEIGTTSDQSLVQSSLNASFNNLLDLGEFNSSSVETILNNFQTGIPISLNDNDPITIVIRDYGSEEFYKAVAAVNLYFSLEGVRNIINQNKEEYSLISDRVETNVPFSPIEVAEFILEYGYTPITLTESTNIVSDDLVFEYNSFYAKNFTSTTMGSFCALLPNIFGTIDAFFDTLDNLADLLSSLKNFALNFSLRSLLDQLKNNILNVIDKVVKKIRNIIENFSIENILLEVASFINEQIVSRFFELKERILRFFDPENIERLKRKILALIDYAMKLFLNPSLEEVQYLLYRFCGFISTVENSINALKNPIEDFVTSYKQTINLLRSNSSKNTARAVTAGAIRYTPGFQNQGINNMKRKYEEAGNVPAPGASEYKEITRWNDGKGDSRVTFVGNWVRPPAPSQLPKDGGVGRDGWEEVDIDVRANLMRIRKEFGRQLKVTSGFRPQIYNDALTGSAKGTSLHINGLALDVTWDGFNFKDERSEEFIRISRKYNFSHIGRYGSGSGNFIHIGVGRNGYWEKA